MIKLLVPIWHGTNEPQAAFTASGLWVPFCRFSIRWPRVCGVFLTGSPNPPLRAQPVVMSPSPDSFGVQAFTANNTYFHRE